LTDFIKYGVEHTICLVFGQVSFVSNSCSEIRFTHMKPRHVVFVFSPLHPHNGCLADQCWLAGPILRWQHGTTKHDVPVA
jgi:hypothetical protein